MVWLSDRLAAPPLVPMSAPAFDGDVLRARLRCEVGSPLFVGHYPGEPLLPGICLIDAAAATLARHVPVAPLGRVCGLRLFRKIVPGEIVDLAFASTATGWRADVEVRGERTARFSLLSGAREMRGDTPAPADAEEEIAPQAIAAVLPHRFPMLLVDSAARARDGALIGHYRVSANAPWFAGLPRDVEAAHWPLPRLIAIESFLQSAGLLFSAARVAASRLIVSAIGDAEFVADTAIGETLTHSVTATRMFDAAALVSGTTFCGDRLIARFTDVLVALQPIANPTAARPDAPAPPCPVAA